MKKKRRQKKKKNNNLKKLTKITYLYNPIKPLLLGVLITQIKNF